MESNHNSQFHSDSEIENNDDLVQILAQDLENLVVSFNNNDDDDDDHRHQVFDRDQDELEAVVVEEDERDVNDDEIQVMEVKDDVFGAEDLAENNGCEVGDEKKNECRVLEEGENGETEILGQNYVDIEEENYEIQIQNGDYSGGYGWSDDRDYAADGWGGTENGGGDSGNENRAGNWETKNGAGEWGEGEGEGEDGSGNVNAPYDNEDDEKLKSYRYPLRPDAEDCLYYIRTGMCKYGSNCKYNHPLKKRNQPTREIRKPKEDNNQMERPGQIECKYFLSTGGCKYGKACKFNHGSSRGKTAITPVLEYNFLGLPIRPGEKECPYYMRNGSCKYGSSCRFNHPDPTAVGGNDSLPPPTYGNDGRVHLQNTSQPTMNMTNVPSWSAPRTPDPPASFVPMMYPQTQNIPPPNTDWNGYQAPVPAAAAHVYPSSERGLPIPPAFFLNNPPSDTNLYMYHQQQQTPVSDYPERPGQPECSYFMKTGDCKYRSGCKFHHPKSRTAMTAPSVLSDKGLPLRPDQSICSHYSRYGICKYGPACKYDHPVNFSNSGEGGYRSDGRPLMQQSV